MLTCSFKLLLQAVQFRQASSVTAICMACRLVRRNLSRHSAILKCSKSFTGTALCASQGMYAMLNLKVMLLQEVRGRACKKPSTFLTCKTLQKLWYMYQP